jgi:DNA-binding transcriptional MerR regulator
MDEMHISEAAQALGVSAGYLRLLEVQGRIPPARRDFNGRIYSTLDIALLKSLGIGQRPRKLKRAEDVLEAAR